MIPGSGRFPAVREWQPTPLFLPGKSHGQRALMGYIHEIAKSHVVVRARVGKEFPDVRQNERRIKFLRVGDAVRTAGQLKGEPKLNRGP